MKLSDAINCGITSTGRNAIIKYFEGESITRKEAILAKCFDCMNMYADGRIDCECDSCPLYHFMPYRKNKS